MADIQISGLTESVSLNDGDQFGKDNVTTNETKKVLWSTIKSTLKTYSDTLYPTASLDTDGTLAANSDTKVPSQKAVVTYITTITGDVAAALAAILGE